MIFAKIFIVVFYFWSAIAFAGPSAFSITSPVDRSAKSPSQTELIAELKSKAVKAWLFRFAGAKKFATYESFVRGDVPDRFVIKYELKKLGADKAQWELSGQLDNDGLKRWIRILEAKSGASSSTPKPLLVFSSSLETFVWERTKSEAVDSSISKIFQRYRSRLAPHRLENAPPKTQGEIDSLAESLKSRNLNACVWFHASACKDCITELEVIYFTANPPKRALVQSFALNQGDTLTSVLSDKITPWLSTAIDEVIGSGSLVSSTFRIRVLGVNSFAKFKKLRELLPELDPITSIIIRAIEKETAEFEVSSTLSANDLYQQLPNLTLGEFRLKPESFESGRITARLQ